MIFNQQQYMGASVRSFNASLGWGASTSNLTVNLVEDAVYDNGVHIAGEIFNPIEVGLPTIFTFTGHEEDSSLPDGIGELVKWSFGGIVTNYNQDNSSNGNPLFSVSVSDPREILAGTQLILDDYFGSVLGIPNVLNIFGAVEDIMGLNGNTPDYRNNYGAMQRNATGTPWMIIKDAIHSITQGKLNKHYGTFLQLKNRKYTVNFSDFPQTLPTGYRIQTTDSMSLLDYISDVCDAASHDYYVTLDILYNESGEAIKDENGFIIHEIKINTVNRTVAPERGLITDFIQNSNGASSKSIGVEFRNQTNAKFLLGGNALSMWGVTHSSKSGDYGKTNNCIPYHINTIHQFYGTQSVDGSLLKEIRPNPDNYISRGSSGINHSKKANPYILIDTRDLDNTIYPYDSYVTELNELKACLSGMDSWVDYLSQTEMYKFIPVGNEKIVDDNGDIITTTGVVSEYFGPFHQKLPIYDNKMFYYNLLIKIDPDPDSDSPEPEAIEVISDVPAGVADSRHTTFVPGMGFQKEMNFKSSFADNFQIQFGNHFPAVATNMAPDPNHRLLQDGKTLSEHIDSYTPRLISSTAYPNVRRQPPPYEDKAYVQGLMYYEKQGPFELWSHDIQHAKKSADNELHENVFLVKAYLFLPLDKDGYSQAIRGANDTEDITINMASNANLLNRFTIGLKGKPRFVGYKHTSVPNPHYKKYHAVLKLDGAGGGTQTAMINILDELTGQGNPRNTVKLNKVAKGLDASQIEVLEAEKIAMRKQSFHDFLLQYAKNIGTKYSVHMPQMLITRDSTHSGAITSISPANEGYMTEKEIEVAISGGLLPKNYFKLTNEQGLFSPYVIYRNAFRYNLSSIPDSDICYSYTHNGTIKDAYIKCSVDESVYFVDKPNLLYPKAVISLPSTVHVKEEFDTMASQGLLEFQQHILSAVSGAAPSESVGGDDLYNFLCPEPIQPDFAAIPVKSNVISYGPWYKVGATGAIEYERDESLVPWNYNGFTNLDIAAKTKVSEVSVQQQDENGSIEFHGMPRISLGKQLEWLSDGATRYGPYITDISVDFGEGGIKTAYKMQTWTPKFGKLAKQYGDNIQKFSQEATQASRIRKERKATGFDSKITKVFDLFNLLSQSKDQGLPMRKMLGRNRKRHSSHEIIAGQSEEHFTNGYSNFKNIVVNQPTYNAATQAADDYENKAFVSLNAIYRPYSTYHFCSGALPHYESMNSQYAEFANNNFETANTNFPFPNGHDINIFTMGESIPSNGLLNDGKSYSTTNNYRGIGFKLPMICVGYGHNINGKPVPNLNSYYHDSNGKYVYNSSGNENSDFYLHNYINRPDTWKVGPMDTRWDSRKKMWVPGSLLVEGYLIEDLAAAEGRLSKIPFTSGRMVLCGGSYADVNDGGISKLWDRADASGYLFSGEWRSSGNYYTNLAGPIASGGNPELFVLLINRSSQLSASSGTYIIASPMPNGDYRPLWVDCAPSERDGITT